MFTKNHVFMLLGACISLASCSSKGEQTPVAIETNIDQYDEPVAAKQPTKQEPTKEVKQEVKEAPKQEASTSYSSDEFAELSQKLKIDIDGSDDIQLLKEAASWLGTPYLYAGKDKNGVDCSAFIDAIYMDVYGIKLNRRANEIYAQCERIGADEAKAGDIIFFHSDGKVNETPNYAGIYLKDNTFIITTTKKGVMIETLANRYYKNNFVCFGRAKNN